MSTSQRKLPPLTYRGREEICAACGLNFKKMSVYVEEYGMPAFKVEGAWIALPSDLKKWLEGMRDTQK